MLPLLCVVSKQASVEAARNADDDLAVVEIVSTSYTRTESSAVAPVTAARNLLRRTGGGFNGASAAMTGSRGGPEPVMSPDGSKLLLCHKGVVEIRTRWDGLATGIARSLHVSGVSDPHSATEAANDPQLGRVVPLAGSTLEHVRIVESLASPRCSISKWTPDSRHVITVVIDSEASATAPAAALFIHDSHGNELASLSTAWTHVTPAATSGPELLVSQSEPLRALVPPPAEDVRDALALWHCLAPAGGLCDFSVVDSFSYDSAGPVSSQRSAATLAILGDDGFLRCIAVSWASSPNAVAWSHSTESLDSAEDPHSSRHAVPWLKLTALGVHSFAGVVDEPSCMALAPWPPVAPSRVSRTALPTGDGMLPSSVTLLAVGGSLGVSLQSLLPKKQQPQGEAELQKPRTPHSATPGVVLLRLELPRLCIGVFCGTGDYLSRLPDSGVGVLGWRALADAGTDALPPSDDFIVRSLPGDAAEEYPRAVFGTAFAHKNLALLARLPPLPPGYERVARFCGPQQRWTGTDAGPDGRWSAMCCAPCALAYRVVSYVQSALSPTSCRFCRRRAAGRALDDLPRLSAGEHRIAAVVASGVVSSAANDNSVGDLAAVRAPLPVVTTGLLFQGVDPAAGEAARASLPILAVLDSRQRLVLWHLRAMPPAPRAASQSPRRPREGGEDDYDEALATVERLHVAAESPLCCDVHVQGAQWYALDCLAVACSDQALRFFAIDALLQGTSRESSLTVSPLSVWRRSGATLNTKCAISGAGDGAGVLVLSHDDSLSGDASDVDAGKCRLRLSSARLTNLQELEESGGEGPDSEPTVSLSGDGDQDVQRTTAYWRHVASGAPLSPSVLQACVLALSLSQRGACFALAVAVQGGILAQLLFYASRLESRAGLALAAAGTAVPPADLSTALVLLQAGLVALQELMQPSLQQMISTIATRVCEVPNPTEVLTLAVSARASAHALAEAATPEQLAGLLVPVQVLVLCAGLLAGRARRFVQYHALRAALGATETSSTALFFECTSASAAGGAGPSLPEDCAALEFRWFSAASGTELIRACLLPREVSAWARRAAASTSPGAILAVAPRILALTPQVLLSHVLRTVPSARAVFIEVFFAAWELFHLRTSEDVVAGLDLLLLCDGSSGDDASDFGVHPASLLSVFSPDDPEFSLFVATHLALLIELEVSAVRETRRRGDVQSAQRVLTASRSALATLCLEHGMEIFSRSTSEGPGHSVVSVLQWIATTISSVADADRALLSNFSRACTLVLPQDRPALLGGARNLAADLRVIESISRAFACVEPTASSRNSSRSPPTLRQWFDASVRVRARILADLSTAGDFSTVSAAWSDELLPALSQLGDSALCWCVLDALTQISVGMSLEDGSEASTQAASSLAALQLSCHIFPTIAEILTPELPACIDSSALLQSVLCSIAGCPYLTASSPRHRKAASAFLEVGLAVLTGIGAPNLHVFALLRFVIDAGAVLARYADPDDTFQITSPAWRSLAKSGRRVLEQLLATETQRTLLQGIFANPHRSREGILALVAVAGSESRVADAEMFLTALLDEGPSWLASARGSGSLPGDFVAVVCDVLRLRELSGVGKSGLPFAGTGIIPVLFRALLRSLHVPGASPVTPPAALIVLRGLLVACCRRGVAQLPPTEQWSAQSVSETGQLSSTEADVASEISAALSLTHVSIPPPGDIIAILAEGASDFVSSIVVRRRDGPAIAAEVIEAGRLLSAYADVDSLASGVYALSARTELQRVMDFASERGYLAGALSLLAPPVDGSVLYVNDACASELLDWAVTLTQGAESASLVAAAPVSNFMHYSVDNDDLHPLWRPWLTRLHPAAADVIAEPIGADNCSRADTFGIDYNRLMSGDDSLLESEGVSTERSTALSADSAVAQLLAGVGDLAETVVSVAAGVDTFDPSAVTAVSTDSILAAGHALTSMLRRVPGAVIAVSGTVAQETAATAAQTAMSVLARSVKQPITLTHSAAAASTDIESASDTGTEIAVPVAPSPLRLLTAADPLRQNLPQGRPVTGFGLLYALKNLASFHRAVTAVEVRLWAAGLASHPQGEYVSTKTDSFRVDLSCLLPRLSTYGDALSLSACASELDVWTLSAHASPVLWTAWNRSSHALLGELPPTAELCAQLAAVAHPPRSVIVRALRTVGAQSCAGGETGLAALFFLSAWNESDEGLPSASLCDQEQLESLRVTLVRLSLAEAAGLARFPLVRVGASYFAVTESAAELARAGNSLLAALMRGETAVASPRREHIIVELRSRLAALRDCASTASLGEAATATLSVMCRASSLNMTPAEAQMVVNAAACTANSAISSSIGDALTLSLQAGLVAGSVAAYGGTLCSDFTEDLVFRGEVAAWAPDLRSEASWPASMFQSALSRIENDPVVAASCALAMWAAACSAACAACELRPSGASTCAEILDTFFERCHAFFEQSHRLGASFVSADADAVLLQTCSMLPCCSEAVSLRIVFLRAGSRLASVLRSSRLQAVLETASAVAETALRTGYPDVVPAVLQLMLHENTTDVVAPADDALAAVRSACAAVTAQLLVSSAAKKEPAIADVPYAVALATVALPLHAPVSSWPRGCIATRAAKLVFALVSQTPLDRIPALIATVPAIAAVWERWCEYSVSGDESPEAACSLSISANLIVEAAVYVHLERHAALPFDEQQALMIAALVCRLRDPAALERVAAVLSRWGAGTILDLPYAWNCGQGASFSLLSLTAFNTSALRSPASAPRWLRAALAAVRDAASSCLSADALQSQSEAMPPVAAALCSAVLELALLDLEALRGLASTERLISLSADDSGTPRLLPSPHAARCLSKQCLKDIRDLVTHFDHRATSDAISDAASPHFLAEVGALDCISSIARICGAGTDGAAHSIDVNALQLCVRSQGQSLQLRAVHALKSLFFRLLSEGLVAQVNHHVSRLQVGNVGTTSDVSNAVRSVVAALTRARFDCADDDEHVQALGTFLALLSRDFSRLLESARRIWRSLPSAAGVEEPSLALFSGAGAAVCADLLLGLIGLGLGGPEGPTELEFLRISAACSIASAAAVGGIESAIACEQSGFVSSPCPLRSDLTSTASRLTWFETALTLFEKWRTGVDRNASAVGAARYLHTLILHLAITLSVWTGGCPHMHPLPLPCVVSRGALVEESDDAPPANAIETLLDNSSQASSVMAQSALAMLLKKTKGAWDSEAVAMLSERVRVPIFPVTVTQLTSGVPGIFLLSRSCAARLVCSLASAVASACLAVLEISQGPAEIESLSAVVVDLGTLIRRDFADVVDAAGVFPPDAPVRHSSRWLGSWGSCPVVLTEDEELLVFSALAQLCLHRALAGDQAGVAKGRFASVAVLFGLASPHAIVRVEALALLTRVQASTAQLSVATAGVLRLVSASAPLALPEWLAKTLRASRRKVTSPYSWQDAAPFAHVYASSALQAWRRVVALGVRGSPFATTLPFLVAAMTSMGALEEALLTSLIDPSWARPASAPIISATPAAFAAPVKAYLLFCYRALGTLRVALQSGTSAETASRPNERVLPWGWQAAEPMLLCAVGFCDEALALDNSDHATSPTDSRGVAEYGGDEDADEDSAGGVSIAEPLAEAGGRFFSFARSALSAVTTAVSSAAGHLNEGARSTATLRQVVNDGDVALRMAAGQSPEGGTGRHVIRTEANTGTSRGSTLFVASSARVRAAEAEGWDAWPETTAATTPTAVSSDVDAAIDGRQLAVGRIEKMKSVAGQTLLPVEPVTEGWGFGDIFEASDGRTGDGVATLLHPTSELGPVLDAPVTVSHPHDAEVAFLDPRSTDFAPSIPPEEEPVAPSVLAAVVADVSDDAPGWADAELDLGGPVGGAAEASIASAIEAVDAPGWADAELDLDTLPESRPGDSDSAGAVVDGQAVLEPFTACSDDTLRAAAASSRVAGAVVGAPDQGVPSAGAVAVSLWDAQNALDALDWDALDAAVPLPKADVAPPCEISYAATAAVAEFVVAGPAVPFAAPHSEVPALDSLLDWDAMDSAAPLPSLSPR